MSNKTPLKSNIQIVIENYSNSHKNLTNRQIQWICIPLLTFGFLGMIWSIPFPYLEFLGKYNGFVNWASFVIAISVYYYYKLSPLLSYGVLLMVFTFSAGIVGLEKLHSNHNWPPMGTLSMCIFILGLVFQYIGYKSEGKIPDLLSSFKSFLNGPLWLTYQLIRKF